jgi:hypothetical protein
MVSRVGNGCKTVTVTIRQLKDISKSILMEPQFDLVSTVNYVIGYLSKKNDCNIEVLVKYD